MCGIFAIYSNKYIHINELISIQNQLKHRGKDSYGITFITQNNEKQNIKSLIPIAEYNENIYNNIKIGLTHNRYSTTNNKSHQGFLDEIQPLYFKNKNIEFDLIHNGNIPNVHQYITYDENLSDTQNIITFFTETNANNFENRLIEFINTVQCSYSIIILYKNYLYVLRDQYGYKPLYLGTINGDYCACSEDSIENFVKIRSVKPGEIIKINSTSYNTLYEKTNSLQLKCIFEYIYFMNEKSTYNNQSVYDIRKKLGKN